MESVSKHCNLIFFVYSFLSDSIRKSRAFYPTTSSFSSLFQFVPDRCSIIVLFLFLWKKCLKKIVTASIKISSLCFFFFSFLRQILKKKIVIVHFFLSSPRYQKLSSNIFPSTFSKLRRRHCRGQKQKIIDPLPPRRKFICPVKFNWVYVKLS